VRRRTWPIAAWMSKRSLGSGKGRSKVERRLWRCFGLAIGFLAGPFFIYSYFIEVSKTEMPISATLFLVFKRFLAWFIGFLQCGCSGV
jgi:hypothetical protein